MVPDAELIEVISEKLKRYKAKNIVLDPVMVATSGADLSNSDAVSALEKYILPVCDIVTPNIPETEILSDMKIKTEDDMMSAARRISEKFGCGVLCKGGHSLNDANDFYCSVDREQWFFGKRINNPNTHGTGCTLSSAIAANLAKGYSMEKSIERAKEYISGALSANLNLGHGSGPMNHGFDINSKFLK